MVNFVNRSSHKTTTGTNGSWKTIADFLLGQLWCGFLSRPIMSNKKCSLSACSASFCQCSRSTSLGNCVEKLTLTPIQLYLCLNVSFSSFWGCFFPSFLYLLSETESKASVFFKSPPKSISLLYRIILHQPCILQLKCVLKNLPT